MKNKQIVLLLLASFFLAFTSCNRKDNVLDNARKIVVTGSAEMEFVPDEIYMTFSLKEYLNSARKKVKIDRIKADFLELCKTANIPDSNISIASYAGNERWGYSWYRRRKTEPDFMASISYSIKVNSVEKFDAIVDHLDDKAINNFKINKTSHSTIEEFRKQVKTEALTATKNKAEYLAESIGEEIGEALLIQEIENSYGYIYSNSNVVSQSSMSFESNHTTPDFQKMKLRYEMKAEFRLK